MFTSVFLGGFSAITDILVDYLTSFYNIYYMYSTHCSNRLFWNTSIDTFNVLIFNLGALQLSIIVESSILCFTMNLCDLVRIWWAALGCHPTSVLFNIVSHTHDPNIIYYLVLDTLNFIPEMYSYETNISHFQLTSSGMIFFTGTPWSLIILL